MYATSPSIVGAPVIWLEGCVSMMVDQSLAPEAESTPDQPGTLT